MSKSADKLPQSTRRPQFRPREFLDSLTLKQSRDPENQELLLGRTFDQHDARLSERSELKVVFSTVEIREHALCPGDNPGCSAGTPLAIDWVCQEMALLTVDQFEEQRILKRSYAEMKAPPGVRQKMLLDTGYTMSHLLRATKPVNIARKLRRRTNETRSLDQVHYFQEKVIRAVRNSLFPSRKKKEREFLKQARNFDLVKNDGKAPEFAPTQASTCEVEDIEEPFLITN